MSDPLDDYSALIDQDFKVNTKITTNSTFVMENESSVEQHPVSENKFLFEDDYE